MRRAALALLVLALAAPPAEAEAEAADAVRKCKRVEFTPQSDDLAAGIRARGVSCRYARRFVRRTRGRPAAVEGGWRCRSTLVDDVGLAYTLVRCTREGDRMRWKKF